MGSGGGCLPSSFFTFSLREGREEKRLVPGESLGIMWGRKGSERGVYLTGLTHICEVKERRTLTGFQA